MRGRSIGDRRLLDACRQRGCPVCRRLREESRSHLHALIHEHVTDVETRRGLRASWGLCNWHTWMLLEVDTGVLGASILSEDLLREAIDRVARLPDPSRRGSLATWLGRSGTAGGAPALVVAHARRPRCPLCVTAARTERECLLTLVKSIDDADLGAAYDGSDPLCLPHLVRAIELSPGSRELRRLVERTREKWDAIRETLRSFIDKHDYRTRSAYTDAEATSYVRALEILGGANGLFGNDLAGARHQGRRRARGDRPRD